MCLPFSKKNIVKNTRINLANELRPIHERDVYTNPVYI